MQIPKTFTKEKIKKLKELYPFKSKLEILKEFPEYNWRHLQNIANYIKIKRIYSEKRNGNIEKLFNNTLESYYWLGLIVTDGTILKDGTLKVELAIKDKDYLNNLALYLNTKLYTYPRYNSHKGGDGTCRIKIKDIINGNKLRDLLKIINKKTYEPINIDFIDNSNKLLCFLAGYIDGDGSINKKGYISIDAHKNYEYFFINLGEKLKTYQFINKFTIIKYKDMVRINIDSKGCKKIKEELTKFNLPLMQRKWERILY